jgi:DNA-binding IclR family transcriptional regulator
VSSTERVSDVLELLAKHTRPTPTMVIARECGIPKSSAHNLLNTLRKRQFVAYYRRERAWGLGQRIFEMASDAPLLTHAVAVLEAFEPSCPQLSEVAGRNRTAR